MQREARLTEWIAHRIKKLETAASASTLVQAQGNSMSNLRTPDDRFANLPGYPFAPFRIRAFLAVGDACFGKRNDGVRHRSVARQLS